MATHGGTHIERSNLVFGYDASQPGSRFFPGEATTNYLPSPSTNGRFTTNNTWYTYNTAQYNSNTYFSIGTIGSVSGNVVTLSSVGRTLYDYDCIRPQTTGGGVTAGTNYFVKKLSSTTFTLHAYDGSQNGANGYINPATNTFKVHDSIALDQRISINSTDFPTMWWGPPHTPNMCYVKEVKSEGGPNDNSSFMRIHLTRPSGTDGGMAYGVNPSVNVGDTITVSFWARSNMDRSWSWSTYFGPGYSAPGFGINSTSKWQRFQYTWTASNTYGFYMYFWPGNPGVVPYHVDIADIQVDINKGHATPFTLTSRSTTEALLDLAESSTIDTSAVSFDANSEPTFDGTNDVILTTFPAQTIPNVTIEAVVYRMSYTGRYEAIIQNNVASDDALYVYPNGNLGFWPHGASSLSVPVGQYAYVAASYNGSGITYCVNGNFTTNSGASSDITDWDFLRIGGHSTTDGERWIGKIPVAKVYSKALSQEEMSRNFRAYKTRFGI